MEKRLIAVCVPTYRRPAMLADCIAHVSKATVPDGCALCVVIVDNAPEGTGEAVFEKATNDCPFPILYFQETTRGFASVRNRLVEEALKLKAHFVAFVDDDEFPSPDWLVLHLRALKASGAHVAHGPVIQIPLGESPGAREKQRLSQARSTGSIKHHVSAGNVVFDTKLIALWGLRFDAFFNRVTGEDHDFFERAKNLGALRVWVREAVVYESLMPERRTWGYLLARHYTGGVNNVLKFSHRHSLLQTWLHFLVRILGKLIHLVGSVLMLRPRNVVKDAATVGGYLAALPRCGRRS